MKQIKESRDANRFAPGPPSVPQFTHSLVKFPTILCDVIKKRGKLQFFEFMLNVELRSDVS